MKMYIRLAFSNIIKNRRLYVPHMCTGAGLMTVFYIIMTLSFDDRLKSVKGGNYLPTIMSMGVIVVGLISVILMIYTNGFLMKQRRSEFGLYNVLGMEKRHIGRILFCETVMTGIAALAAGLVFGIVLYKLCALIICRILKVESVLGFYHVSLKVVLVSSFVFVCIYAAIYIFNRIRIAAMKPMKLLASKHEGEKEPKTKWLIALIGFAALGAGYYIALTTKSPLKALTLFFVAVILVIVGTYFLFMAGSIVILKILRNKKEFYYRSRNMIGISGMIYRMKQNAAGLASIAILATCVLVMMSSTVTLYAGIEDSVKREFPHQVSVGANYEVLDPEKVKNFEWKLNSEEHLELNDDEWDRYYEALERKAVPEEVVIDALKRSAKENGLEISYIMPRQYLMVAYKFDGRNMIAHDNLGVFDDLAECFFVTADYYDSVKESSTELKKGEIAVAQAEGNSKNIRPGDTISIEGYEFKVKEILDDFVVPMEGYSLADCYGIVVSDDEVFEMIYQKQLEEYGRYASDVDTDLLVDFTDEELAEELLTDKGSQGVYNETFRKVITDYIDQQENTTGGYYTSFRSKWEFRNEAYGMIGTLMFLGILLSIVFIMATALIIYYKQVSEGYDDRERFHIMQKVGMGSDEVKGTIRSQVLTVFFMPLLVAGIHMCMAFPIIVKLMKVLVAPSMWLFMGCTLAAFLIFGGIYVVIYILTARMYYHIVRLNG